MIAVTLLMAACAPLPAAQQEPAAQAQSAPRIRFDEVVSERVGDEIHYSFREVEWISDEREIRADRVYVRLAGEPYAQTLAGSRLIGSMSEELIGRPGEPVRDALVLELRLQGNVEIINQDGVLRCDWAVQQPPLGLATFDQVELTLRGDLGPRGWPWRLRAASLQELANGDLKAKRVQLTACDLDDPAYALAMRELTATLQEDGNYVWSPSAPWLEVRDRRVLPMPAFDFRTGDEDGGFGLRSVRISSGQQLGTAVELGFAASTDWRGGNLDWRLFPALSTLRGFPLRTTLDYRKDGYRADWSLFALSDRGEDVHALANRVARDNRFRWRLRLDNRFELDEFWRLDADLALTSDPLVDPEFFRREWVAQDDALSELYLRRQDDQTHFSVRATARLDDTGFTPLGGYGRPGSGQTQQLDLLPEVRFESFAREIASYSAGRLGGRDRQSPIHWSWGLEANRARLRTLDEIDSAFASRPFAEVDDVARDRARVWTELDTQWLLGPVVLRPGLSFESGAVHQVDNGDSDTQASIEAFVEASLAMQRSYENGWIHRVRPMLRFRDRHMLDEANGDWYPFTAFDRRRDGKAIEMSLRQMWYGPQRHSPWLDLNLLVPYYPESSEPLPSETFPSLRSSQPDHPWGPGELRAVWDPGVRRGMLTGLRASSNLRYRFDEDHLEEWYARLSIAPQKSWRITLSQRLFDQIEDPQSAFRSTSFDADWRINESFEFKAGRTFSSRGNSTTRTRYGLTYYGHGFAFEVYTSRNDQTGEDRYGINLVPCFLVERFQSDVNAPHRAEGLEY